MAAGHQPPERVDSYLKRLPLHDKLRLMEQLESVRLYDNQVANANIVLNALRDDLREAGAMPQRRLPSPSRVFFEPLQPFLIHRRADRPRHGRIARRSLASIWAWTAATCCPKRPRPTPI